MKKASYTKLFSRLICYTSRVSTKLDDEAKAGLVYTMRRTGLSHPDAARFLLTNAVPPEPAKKQGIPTDSPKYRL